MVGWLADPLVAITQKQIILYSFLIFLFQYFYLSIHLTNILCLRLMPYRTNSKKTQMNINMSMRYASFLPDPNCLERVTDERAAEETRDKIHNV